MKKTKLRLLVITIGILVLIMLSNKSKAATLDSNTLIKSAGVTITKDMTADQVTKAYGAQPKLVTPSAFGGKMYTYYKTDYKDLLYIETDSNNKIVSYGAMSDDFVTSKYSAGDKKPWTEYFSYLDGDSITDRSSSRNIIGVLMYNKSNITTDKVNAYFVEFMKDKYTYQKYISQHSVVMLNCYLKKYEPSIMVEYNESYYDIINRLKSDGISIKDYAEKNGKNAYYKQTGVDTGNYCNYSELPSPLRAVNCTVGYNPTTDKKYAYLNYELNYDESSKKYTGNVSSFYFGSKLFEDSNGAVALTVDEENKLNNVKNTYQNSVNLFNQNGNGYYITEPVYDRLPLVAGEIKENKLKGSVEFLNSIRVGAGLTKLNYDKNLSYYAQHKAVLISYINNKGIAESSPHYPKKPDGVSQEFYDNAQKYLSAENLYNGDIITSITHALNDAYGDPITTGHRYNLLDPDYTNFGLGTEDGQSAHRFSGYVQSNVEMVAWPSAGVTPVEAFSGGYWTCKFYKNYSPTSSSQVYVKRLNDNAEWKFEKVASSGQNLFEINNDMVSFYNADLSAQDGYVYQITVKNVKNKKTGKTEDITYRSVLKNALTATQKVYPASIPLDRKQITANINSKVMLKTTFSSGATEIRTIWSSSNSNVATVNQLGEVTIVGSGTATITVKTLNGKTATCVVTVQKQDKQDTTNKKVPDVGYRTHVQNDGWQGYVRNGAMSGTSGRSLRLEGININLDNNEYGGGIEYRTHVQNIGWQSYVKNGAMSGTSGRSLRLEAIQIRLTGEISKYYDVYYRVHCQNFGWLDWAKNGEEAGSSGYAYRLEGIEIRLVKKGGAAPGKTTKPYIRKYLTYQTHVQNIGWQGAVRDNETSGTSGQSLRLEGIKINLDDQKYSGDIEYRTHVQNIGWQGFVKNGAMSGTSGKSLRLEAIQIRLTGEMAKKYDVYYRVHCQNFGWLGWAKNGQSSGSAGYSYRLEAIEICLVEKGSPAPGSTQNSFYQK